MFKACLSLLLAVMGVFSIANRAEASVVLTGTGTPGHTGWNYVHFHHAGGSLSINVLASGWSGGPTGVGERDSAMVLFRDDGSPNGSLTGTWIGTYFSANFLLGAGSLTGGAGPYADGPIGFSGDNDPYVFFSSLAAEDYVLAIARDPPGFVSDVEGRARRDDLSVGRVVGDYQITFSADVTFGGNPVPVSEPGLAVLLFTGLGAMGIVGRRRRSTRS
jgi:hypothetical protein